MLLQIAALLAAMAAGLQFAQRSWLLVAMNLLLMAMFQLMANRRQRCAS